MSTSERLDAGLVLIEMDNNYAAAVAATVFTIVDKTEGWEQKMAVQVLAECGPAAEQAVPWLEQAVRDLAAIEDVEGGYDRIDLAASAAVALARIQCDTSHVMAPLISMLADKSWRKRISAAEALGALGSQGQVALPASGQFFMTAMVPCEAALSTRLRVLKVLGSIASIQHCVVPHFGFGIPSIGSSDLTSTCRWTGLRRRH